MAALDSYTPLMASRKRSLSEMKAGRPVWTGKLDLDEYNNRVLQLTGGDSEDALDQRLAMEAHQLGLNHLPIVKTITIDGLTSSLSVTTIGSENNMNPRRPSQSTNPTSCASSERRQVLRSPYVGPIQTSPSHSATPSVLSNDGKRSSLRYSLRTSIKRMTGFRRRKSSVDIDHSALSSIDGNIAASPSDRMSFKNSLKSPISLKSYSSSSSNPGSPINGEKPMIDDEESIKRTMNSPEIQSLRDGQLNERSRFLAYQRQCLEQLRYQHKVAKQKMHDAHIQAAAEMEEKNLLAADDLESRQLEAEAKFRQELEAEKRACLIRLRHMEAYCHSPSPPATPQSGLSHSDEHLEYQYPERIVTDKDYHNLAAQYRERDAMDSLHKARIEVMQGRQEKVYNDFVKRKERELATLVANQGKAETKFTARCDKEEGAMMQAFEEKRMRLQVRWTLQGLVQCSRLERETNHHFAPLPELSFELDSLKKDPGQLD